VSGVEKGARRKMQSRVVCRAPFRYAVR